MAVAMIGSQNNRFIGLSTDAKPSGPAIKPGATYFAYDIQTMYITPNDGTLWVPKEGARNNAVAVTTINLRQAAGAKDLFEVVAQGCLIDTLGIVIPTGLSGETTFTGISIQSTDTAPVVFLDAADGVKAKLDTAGKHLIYNGPDLVEAGKKIQLTIAGGATAANQVCTVFVSYRPLIAGGYLVAS